MTSHLKDSTQSDKREEKRWDNLPSFDQLPKFHEHSGCAWSVWGADDELGTINLLTEEVVRGAAKEIR